MELDELKNTWTVLENQLKKNETLNQQLMREMIHKKSHKSLNRLINIEFVNIILWLLVIPFFIWIYQRPDFAHLISTKILSVTTILMSILALILSFNGIKNLLKIDFPKSIKDNILYLNKYQIIVKRDKFFTYFVFTPILSLLAMYCYYEFKAKLTLWIFMIVALVIAVVITYWMYKKLYDANIQDIKKSLEEMKELNEEE